MSYYGINTVHIEIAREVCNIRCSFCYIDFDNPKKVPYDYSALTKVLDYCRDYDVEAVTIQGGEITAIDEGYEFCKQLQEIGCSLNVMTNGVRINEGWLKIFSESCHRVNISLNASTRETFQKIIGFDGWQTVHDNILKINERKKIHSPWCELSMSMVIVKENFHEVVDFYLLSREMGVDYVCLYPDVTSKFMADLSNPSLRQKGKELYQELKTNMMAYSPIHPEDLVSLQIFRDFVGVQDNDINIPVAERTRGNAPYRNVTGKKTHMPADVPGEKAYCKMPSSMVYVDTKMDVHTCCGTINHSYGNLKDEKLETIILNKKRDELQLKTKAGDYSICAPYCPFIPRN